EQSGQRERREIASRLRDEGGEGEAGDGEEAGPAGEGEGEVGHCGVLVDAPAPRGAGGRLWAAQVGESPLVVDAGPVAVRVLADGPEMVGPAAATAVAAVAVALARRPLQGGGGGTMGGEDAPGVLGDGFHGVVG